MAALLIFLHNNLSVTDILCSWNSKKEMAEDEGKPIDVLYPRTVFEPYSAPLPDEVYKITIQLLTALSRQKHYCTFTTFSLLIFELRGARNLCQ